MRIQPVVSATSAPVQSIPSHLNQSNLAIPTQKGDSTESMEKVESYQPSKEEQAKPNYPGYAKPESRIADRLPRNEQENDHDTGKVEQHNHPECSSDDVQPALPGEDASTGSNPPSSGIPTGPTTPQNNGGSGTSPLPSSGTSPFPPSGTSPLPPSGTTPLPSYDRDVCHPVLSLTGFLFLPFQFGAQGHFGFFQNHFGPFGIGAFGFQQPMGMLHGGFGAGPNLGAMAFQNGMQARMADMMKRLFDREQFASLKQLIDQAHETQDQLHQLRAALRPSGGQVDVANAASHMAGTFVQYETLGYKALQAQNFIKTEAATDFNRGVLEAFSSLSGSITHESGLVYNHTSWSHFVDGMDKVLNQITTVPISHLMAPNPYNGVANQLRQAGAAYAAHMTSLNTKQGIVDSLMNLRA